VRGIAGRGKTHYNRLARRIQAIHHAGQQLELALDSVREEVGIDEDIVGWDEGGVVLEEEGGGDLRSEEAAVGQ